MYNSRQVGRYRTALVSWPVLRCDVGAKSQRDVLGLHRLPYHVDRVLVRTNPWPSFLAVIDGNLTRTKIAI